MEILIFIICSAIGSSFYTLSVKDNDTLREIVIGVGLGTCLSVGIVLILYDFINKPTACAGVSLLTGGLGTKFTSSFGKKILSNFTDIGKKTE